MEFHSKYLFYDREILHDEYRLFKRTIDTYDPLSPFYVYIITTADGIPIYVGKGKNKRAYSHLRAYARGKSINKNLQKALDENDQPPIVMIYRGNLLEILMLVFLTPNCNIYVMNGQASGQRHWLNQVLDQGFIPRNGEMNIQKFAGMHQVKVVKLAARRWAVYLGGPMG